MLRTIDYFRFQSFRRDIEEVYEYRNVLKSLIKKNLYGRYKNSFLGFAWNFITPIILMLMYYVVFNEIKTDTTVEDSWLFISSAIFIFHFLSSCIVGGTDVFISNAGMIKKMYMPKEILILSRAISSMIVCATGCFIVTLIILIVKHSLNWLCLLFLPVLLFFIFLFGVGCLFLLSSLTVYVRDIQYALGPMGIALFVMTPMRYMASDATGLLGIIIWYNPLTYYIEWSHQILYWGVVPDGSCMFICLTLSIVMLSAGYLTFKLLKHGFVRRL